MMKKKTYTKESGTKGQLSYEYIIVIGMVLLLAIPFFYSFFRYLVGGFNNQMNADMVTRISHATETLASLGGVGSKYSIPVRMAKVTSNTLRNNRISITTSNQQTYSAPVGTGLNVKLGSEALVGDGFQNVPLIYTYLNTIAIGSQPQIVGLCPAGEIPYSSRCSTTTTIKPNEAFRVLGANFQSTQNAQSVVMLSKIQGQQGGCQTFTVCTIDSDCSQGHQCKNGICADIVPQPLALSSDTPYGEGELILDVGTQATGTGSFAVAVANPGSEVSGCLTLQVQAGGGEEDD